MKNILNIFKGIGNDSFEMGRLMWFLGGMAMIGNQAYALFKGQNFSPIEFGGGFAALLAAGGFGIAAKDKVTNPAPAPVTVGTVQGDIQSETTNVGNVAS